MLQAGQTMAFDKLKIDDISNDACTFGDFNKDGRMDIACADSWYQAPPVGTSGTWTKHVFRVNRQDDMLLAMDVDGDGWTDLIAGAHGDGIWYKNNGLTTGVDRRGHGLLMGHSGEPGYRRRWQTPRNPSDVATSLRYGVIWWSWVCYTISTAKDNWEPA
jgi:hypothetical protein